MKRIQTSHPTDTGWLQQTKGVWNVALTQHAIKHKVRGDAREGPSSLTRTYCMSACKQQNLSHVVWIYRSSFIAPLFFFLFNKLKKVNLWLVSEICWGSSSASDMYSTGSGSWIYLANVAGKKPPVNSQSGEEAWWDVVFITKFHTI